MLIFSDSRDILEANTLLHTLRLPPNHPSVTTDLPRTLLNLHTMMDTECVAYPYGF